MKSALNIPLMAAGLGILSQSGYRPYSQGPMTLGGALGVGGVSGLNTYANLYDKKDWDYQVINDRLVKINKRTGDVQTVKDFSTPKTDYKAFGPDQDVYSVTDGKISPKPVLDFDQEPSPPTVETFTEGSKQYEKQWNPDTREWEVLSESPRWKPETPDREWITRDGNPMYVPENQIQEGDTPYNKSAGEWSDPYVDSNGNIAQKNKVTNSVKVVDAAPDPATKQRWDMEIQAARDTLTSMGVDWEAKDAMEKIDKSLLFLSPQVPNLIKKAKTQKFSETEGNSENIIDLTQ